MSKTLISVLVVGVVLVGGYFLITKNKVSNTAENPNLPNKEATKNPEAKKMAFSEFVKQGGAYKCEVKQAMSDFENNGTVYISGNSMRGEFSTIAEGRAMDTSFIFKDGYSYTWSSTLPNMGFKMKANTDQVGESFSGMYSWNADQIGDYNCDPWTVDAAKFVLPASVTFKDLGSVQK